MQKRTLWMATSLLFAVMSSALAEESTTPSPQQALTVGTFQAAHQTISRSTSYVGRVEAVDRVEIVARVSGFLENILFKEGDFVQAGAPLYTIEKGLFEAAVQQARGSVASAKAAVILAEQQKVRTTELLEKEVATKVSMDQAVAAVQHAYGEAETSAANLQTAQINLGYTDIKSPISGRIGRTAVTKGNVVGPDSGVLTVIVSQDPMYVTFPVSQREFLRAHENGGKLDMATFVVRIRFSDGTIYSQTGKVNFIDVTANQETDTIAVRATFENANGVLVDGQLVNVDVESGTPEEVVVVPQSALLADQSGPYVFIVENGHAAVKRVKLGGESGPNAVIAEGLGGGELVIVEGLQFVRPGMPVSAAPITAPSDPS